MERSTTQVGLSGREANDQPNHLGSMQQTLPEIVVFPPEDDISRPEPMMLQSENPDPPPVGHEQPILEDPFGDETPKPKKAKPLVSANTFDSKTSTKKQSTLEQFQDVRRRVRKHRTFDDRTEKEPPPGQVSISEASTPQPVASWMPKDNWPTGKWKMRVRCSIPPGQAVSTTTEPHVDVILVYLYAPTANDKSPEVDADLNLFRHASKQETTISEPKSRIIRQAKVVNWLTDDAMLPQSLPGARITTVGFDVNPAGVLSAFPSVETAAAQLADYLSELRARHQPPIIFIGHSLGAMFILQSLSIESVRTDSNVSILQHTAGLLAFAHLVPTSAKRSQMQTTLYGMKATDKLLGDLSAQPSTARSVKSIKRTLAAQSSYKGPSQALPEEKNASRVEVGFPIHQVYARDERQDSNVSLSSFIGVPVQLGSSDKDYSNVLQFTNPRDEDFVRLVSTIETCLHTYKFLRAAASGTVDEIDALICQGVEVNLRDRW
ncbi:hypothetical protein K491DRAFT_261633 [Lophiostoma macrostomum CBS 122681]|uniref:Uncharacterized protein n=1 Tax=Lophiostoma macrostomum CBS 122681 TaxID=1314788 RepID=A0A6A6SKZ1_9PLEO|nr:hypothetical protein K491DRAFT_261633 [Lophiostoma macrostomum CBS 122681]